MTKPTKVRKGIKVFIIIVLAVFLISTGLISILYLADTSQEADEGYTTTGTIVDSGINEIGSGINK